MEDENTVSDVETGAVEVVENVEVGGDQIKTVAEDNGEEDQVEEEGEHIEGVNVEEDRQHIEGVNVEEEEETIIGENFVEVERKEDKTIVDSEQVEEEEYVEPPPLDPAAPYNLTDSSEAIKPKFELRPDQTAEVEQLWELYQNYTPAYTDICGYITEKEVVYMLKSLLLMTFTPEQLQELIAFCVRPPHPEGHINYQQFLNMVTIRQRDLPIEEELRVALKVFDPGNSGLIDREYFKEILSTLGHKMPQRLLDALIKEVDLSNDGTIGIEDVIGTMCIDLNKEDIIMLQTAVYGAENAAKD